MKRSLWRPVLLSLPLLAAGCGNDLLFAELDGIEVCTALPAQRFPGNPYPQTQVPPQRQSATTQLDLGAQLGAVSGLDVDLRLTSATLELVQGKDLAFLDALRLQLVPPAADTADAPATLVDWREPADEPPATTLSFAPATQADLYRLVSAGPVQVALDATATPPAQDTEVALRLCFTAKARYAYARSAGL